MNANLADLATRFIKRDRGALARSITLADNGLLPTDFLASAKLPERPALRVGITGPGGAGKSTLCAGLIVHLRSAGKRVAVLACDPSSPFSGGALLGDRVRMDIDPADEGIFVRSISSRGATGGLSDVAGRVLGLLNAFGFDVVLVETVGAGQDQLAVRELVDVLVLVLTPVAGDEVQWEKAGLLEAADVVAVNKADLPGADAACAGLRSMLDLSVARSENDRVPILKVVASQRRGIDALWQSIAARAASGRSPTRSIPGRRLLTKLQALLADRYRERMPNDPKLRELASAADVGSMVDPIEVAEALERLATSS